MTELKNLKRQQTDGANIVGNKERIRGEEDYVAFINNKEGERKELDDCVNQTNEASKANLSLILN